MCGNGISFSRCISYLISSVKGLLYNALGTIPSLCPTQVAHKKNL
uniref:Uncharacterized protein n=1 Tax=Rhizophora mucronata TaxID=61149 RepID=A0A2P2IK17_RHIMU